MAQTTDEAMTSVSETVRIASRSARPYPPSWIDQFDAWLDGLSVPGWLPYLLLLAGAALLINVVFWVDGSVEIGSVSPINTGFAIFIAYLPALYHYLTGVASRALQSFRPLLDAEEDELERLDYEFRVLPRWIGWLAAVVGFGSAVLQLLGETDPYGDVVPNTPLPYAGDVLLSGFIVATFLCLTVRSIRQLRAVARLHARATHINLLELRPVHSFSNLTARTGVGIILLLVITYAWNPLAYGSVYDIAATFITAGIAIAVFALPIMGIQDRIEEEKEQAIRRTNEALRIVTDRLHDQVRRGTYGNLAGTEDTLAALTREREMIMKISTWPWDPRALRGFSSALLLGVLVWLATRLLERVV